MPDGSGGSGYAGAPMVTISGGTGVGATAVANMVDDGSGNGTLKVGSITVTNRGIYTVDPTTVTLSYAGATTNANSGTFTISTDANTSGGLTKSGSGTLILTATNTYAGTTTVANGTLLATVPGTLPNYMTTNQIVANPGATLAVQMGGTKRMGRSRRLQPARRRFP